MSDYNPNLGPGPDRYGRYPYDPARDPAYDYDPGRSGFALLAILAGLALVGGVLYFGNPTNHGDQQARTPAPQTTSQPAPQE